MRIAKAMTPGLLNIQHRALQGRNTTTLATKLLNDLHTQDGYVALLDVAKAFPSVPEREREGETHTHREREAY